MTATPLQEPIIQSLLDTDLYKFTMLQVVLHQFPQAHGEYEFRCRNSPAYPLSRLKEALDAELTSLCSLHFTKKELDFLRSLRFIKSDFVDYLELFRLQRRFVHLDTQGDQLIIQVKGPLVQAMFFEIFILSTIHELYCRPFEDKTLYEEGQRRLDAKIHQIERLILSTKNPVAHPFLLFDFGTRRRFSRRWHRQVVKKLQEALPTVLRGTSDVYLAWQLGITPIGTMAHEFMQAFQALDVRLRNFQKAALEAWVQEYRGDLGIALTDVVGIDAFLRDFDLYFAKLFDGLRHDSGDPLQWAYKVIKHYEMLRIDPMTKMLSFSDQLDIDKAIMLYQTLGNKIRTSFGVGTNLTNDMGIEPLQIVLKLIRCNGQSVAKITDNPSKTMCNDSTFIAYLKQTFEIQHA